jgi:hypothetical protein
VSRIAGDVAKWPNAGVCKTLIHRFDSDRRLHLLSTNGAVRGPVTDSPGGNRVAGGEGVRALSLMAAARLRPGDAVANAPVLSDPAGHARPIGDHEIGRRSPVRRNLLRRRQDRLPGVLLVPPGPRDVARRLRRRRQTRGADGPHGGNEDDHAADGDDPRRPLSARVRDRRRGRPLRPVRCRGPG